MVRPHHAGEPGGGQEVSEAVRVRDGGDGRATWLLFVTDMVITDMVITDGCGSVTVVMAVPCGCLAVRVDE